MRKPWIILYKQQLTIQTLGHLQNAMTDYDMFRFSVSCLSGALPNKNSSIEKKKKKKHTQLNPR